MRVGGCYWYEVGCLLSFDNCTDDPDRKKGNHLEQREKLGLTAPNKGASRSRTPLAESADAMQKVEV